MQVPMLDLKAQYATIKDEILQQVNDVLDTQRCIGGPKIEQIEQAIAKASDCKYALGVSSGTDAILNCLMSLGIGIGDEVITTPFTFFATVGCIARVGGTPVFVDIDEKTYNIDPAKIEDAITDKTKAIIPVHLFGQICDMDPIMEIANKHGLHVIEDACQSITSTYKNRKAGSFGTAGCFSFFPSKNLGGIGDGGMIVTNDDKFYEMIFSMRNHGGGTQYYHDYVGGNFRLDPIQAGALLVKLPHLDDWSAARRENAQYYNSKFADSDIVTPYIREDCVSIYNQYVLRVPKRDQVMQHLKDNNIGCAIYYPVPLHLQACFKYLGYKPGDMPVSEQAAKDVLALPVYPELTDQMQDYVAEKVLEIVNG